MFWHNVETIKASWTDETSILFSKTCEKDLTTLFGNKL